MNENQQIIKTSHEHSTNNQEMFESSCKTISTEKKSINQ